MSETVYLRLPSELKEAVVKRAEGKGIQLNEAITELLNGGLVLESIQKRIEGLQQEKDTLEADLDRIKAEKSQLELEIRDLRGKLELREREVSLARQARNETLGLLSRLTILRCRHCYTQLTVQDLSIGICPNRLCRRSGFEVSPEYRGSSTGETVREGLAVIGGVALIAALLQGLSRDSD